MNLLKFYPKPLRKNYINNIVKSGTKEDPSKVHNKIILRSGIFTGLVFVISVFLKLSFLYVIFSFFAVNVYFYFRLSLKASARIKKMENVFPDVISLMASNLRAGMTIDRAFFLSAREEFAPLDDEILNTGKEIATGSDVLIALKKMGDKIGSVKISKTVLLIISGLRSGGNVSDLLESTATNMRQKEFIEKRAASSILMYVIFIFFAIGVGAPFLFGLSSVLVDVVIDISSRVPETSSAQLNLPLTFQAINISPNLILYFSLAFIIVTDLISSLVIGMVNKGEAKTGLKYFIPLASFSLTVFFGVRLFLGKYLSEAISNV